jgi:hypothetical protein
MARPLSERKLLKPVKTAKQMLKADVETLQERPEELGLSDSEKQKIASEAQAQADARATAQISELGRTALAGQGFQQGALQEAARETAAEATAASAQATSAAEKMSREMIARESARIRAALDAQRGRARETNTMIYGDALTAAGTGASILGEKYLP